MRWSMLSVCMVALMMVLAGCSGMGPDETTTVTTDDPPTTTEQSTPVEHSVHVFDGSDAAEPVIEGGLTLDDGRRTTYLATLLTDASETDRVRRDALPDEAATFVGETDFDSESLVVIQATPKSSVPDYRVESVTRSGDELDVRINDSAEAGTDDITVETVLVRVSDDGSPPSNATITTQDGTTFDTDDGIVTPASEDEDASDTVALPFRSDNDTNNVDDPRDLRLTNDREAVVGYTVSVTATQLPACTDADPPCGETVHVEDLIAMKGTYTIDATVESTRDSERMSVSEEFEWRVTETYHDAFVSVTDSGVEITQSVE